MQNTPGGKNWSHSQKLRQFGRRAFKELGELLFDKMFSYDRGLKETFQFSNSLKNGSLQERRQIDQILQFSKGSDDLESTDFGNCFFGKSHSMELVSNLLSDDAVFPF